MKAIEILDAIEQMDSALINSYLHCFAEESETQPASAGTAGLHRTVQQETRKRERRITLLSAAGVLGSIAACIALVLGFRMISRPDPISTEQSSDICSLDEASDTTMPAGTTVFGSVTATGSTNTASATTTTSAQAAETASHPASQKAAPVVNPSASAGTQLAGTKQSPARETTTNNAHLVAVPNLIGKTVAEINRQYEKQFMITVQTDPIPSEASDEGYNYKDTIVYSQSIPAGTMIRDNIVITVHSSLSGEPQPSISSSLPNIIGMQIWDADGIFRDAGYCLIGKWSNRSDEPEGTVFQVSEPETSPYGYIHCLVSNGTGNKMPELTGLSYIEATQVYGESVRIIVKGYVVTDDDTPYETIVEQSVAPGTPIYRDADLDAVPEDLLTTVYVTLTGSEKDLYAPPMPDLIGTVIKSPANPLYSDAHQLVPGSELQFRYDKTSDLPRGTIIAQDPQPGEPLWSRNKVTITVALPEKISLPDLIGMSMNDAYNLLVGEGLVPFVMNEHVVRPDLPAHSIAKVYPEDLSDLREGMGVRLYLSTQN